MGDQSHHDLPLFPKLLSPVSLFHSGFFFFFCLCGPLVVCVCVCVCARARAHVRASLCAWVGVRGCVSVAIAVVQRSVLPLYVEDRRCTNLLYYYYCLPYNLNADLTLRLEVCSG